MASTGFVSQMQLTVIQDKSLIRTGGQEITSSEIDPRHADITIIEEKMYELEVWTEATKTRAANICISS